MLPADADKKLLAAVVKHALECGVPLPLSLHLRIASATHYFCGTLASSCTFGINKIYNGILRYTTADSETGNGSSRAKHIMSVLGHFKNFKKDCMSGSAFLLGLFFKFSRALNRRRMYETSEYISSDEDWTGSGSDGRYIVRLGPPRANCKYCSSFVSAFVYHFLDAAKDQQKEPPVDESKDVVG